MPRNAAVTRITDPAPAQARPSAVQVTLSLTHPTAIAAWEALVARCGSPNAAFEALVLLPEVMREAGFDPDPHLRQRSTP